VGSSLSMGLRNAVMGLGALGILVWTNPVVMLQVALVLVLIVVLAPYSRISSWLLSPYLLWVTIAAALNLATVRLNPPSP